MPIPQSTSQRPGLSVLDRLLDDAQEAAARTPADGTAALRRAVRRDLEALLNARRSWRSWPAGFAELAVSPLGYGIADFSAGSFATAGVQEQLCRDVEDTIRRFEPRLSAVHVSLADQAERLQPTLRLRIEALLRAQPAPEPIAFDTVIDAATADVTLRPDADV